MARRRTVINFAGQMTIPFEEFGNAHPIPAPGESADTANDNPATRVINYISFGSGSSGNCCYVGTRHGGFLIDAGVNAEEVTDGLKANGVKLEQVKGASDFLLEIMPLLFVPAVVGLMDLWDVLRAVLIPAMVIAVASTLVGMAVSGHTAQWMHRRKGGKGNE